MTKEELIGRKFINSCKQECEFSKYDKKEDTFFINKPCENMVDYPVGSLAYVNKTILGGTWKLIEDKPKMYKTNKGIEYGVGTQFKTASNGGIELEVSKIENGVVYWNKLGSNEVHWQDKHEKFSELLDTSWHVINTMKDYKQVDPKTIRFDFSHKYIKTNNKEEYDWIVEVASYNKYKYSGGVPVDYLKGQREQMHFGYTGYNLIGYSPNSFKLSFEDFKEITIQDILNNMKEVIEVGDTVESKTHYSSSSKMEVVRIDGDRLYNKDGCYYNLKDIKLVSKGKKKEIIGYETVVDLPGIPKCTVLNVVRGEVKIYADETGSKVAVDYTKWVSDIKFFKPIYKQDTIDLKFSKYTATLSKEHGLVFTDNERISYTDLQKLLAYLELPAKFGKFDVKVVPAVVRVGCKSFTPDDILVAQNGIKELE